MNDKLISKARLLMTIAAANCTSSTSPAVAEALGYVLAHEAQLPSSAGRVDLAQTENLHEAREVISIIGENTMHDAKRVYDYTLKHYSLRHNAAFNGILFATEMYRGVKFDHDQTITVIRALVEGLVTSSNPTVAQNVAS